MKRWKPAPNEVVAVLERFWCWQGVEKRKEVRLGGLRPKNRSRIELTVPR